MYIGNLYNFELYFEKINERKQMNVASVDLLILKL